LSLLASIFTTPFLISIFTDWGDFHGGVGLILISGLYIIYPFVLSLAAYLNLIKGFQKNNYLSFFSFTFLPLFFPINLLYEFKIGLDLMGTAVKAKVPAPNTKPTRFFLNFIKKHVELSL